MTARTALIDGAVGVVVAPSGRLMLVLVVTIANGKITGVDVVADPERLGSRNWRCWTEQPADKIRQTKNPDPRPRGDGRRERRESLNRSSPRKRGLSTARIYVSVGIEQHDGAQSQVSSCEELSGTSETPCMAIGFWDGGVASGTIAGAVTFGLE
jgi:hypothetical protein